MDGRSQHDLAEAAAPGSEDYKRQAAEAAVSLVASGMKLGLGTGSTAEAFVRALAKRIGPDFSVVGVPTSERTAALARELGVPLTTLDEEPELDLTIDGADEIDAQLRLIKGGGGALLREKIVAAASRRMVVVADGSKRVETLGRFPLPIEIVPFGLGATRIAIAALARKLNLDGPIVTRAASSGSGSFITDGGHLILDASFGQIPDPEGLAAGLAAIPGVVEHGLFLGLTDEALIGGPGGVARLTAR